MNNALKSLIVVALLTAGYSTQLTAQKFGYINSQELMSQIPELKEAEANIETLKKQLQKKGQDMITALQTKYADLQKKQDNGELSPVQLEQEATKLREEEARIGEFDRSSQEKIYTKTNELLAPIQEKINNAIDEVARDNGYDYIFDTGLGVVLYADPASDVSSQVKAKLGL